MVKNIASFFIYTIFFVFMLIYFAPKINLYYYLETKLENKGLIISGEDVNDKGLYLDIKNSQISYKSITSANIVGATIKMYGVYNSIYLSNITLSTTVKSVVPLYVDNVKVIYSILNPLNIKAHGKGEFGEFKAKFNILDKTLHLELIPADIMNKEYKSTLRNFSKNEDGELCYDKNF